VNCSISCHNTPRKLNFVFINNTVNNKNSESAVTKTAGRFLLTDPDLLSSFVRIVVTNTNVHDNKAVMDLFDSLCDWFKLLKDHEITIPETFEIDTLIKCFDIIFEVDHHVLLGLLFNFFHFYIRSFMSVDIFLHKLIGDRILENWFFRFFLHWDFKIRTAFFQILVYHVSVSGIISFIFLVSKIGGLFGIFFYFRF
jgi:hypothetical protein